MTLPETCIRRPVMTTLLMLAFVIFGLFGYQLLPVAALPRVDFPTIVVSAQLPGASPETMASSVATPLERQFSTIAGLNSIVSTNGLGVTSITMQFDLERNIDGAALDVQSALTTAQRKLPPELTTPPSFQKVNPADQPVLFISLSSATLPLPTIHEFADTLMAQRISTLPGVAQVQIQGGQKAAVRIRFNPDALASKGIGVDEIRTAIIAANSNTPLGTLNGESQGATLKSNGQLAKAEDYKSLIVAYRNGAPVRLGEVATPVDGAENERVAGWVNGKRSIMLAIQRQPDANTVQVVDRVRELIPVFREQIPPSINIDVLSDRSVSIRHSVEDVRFTLLLTVGLVVMVIFVFLRNVTATMIPALALPVSVIGTFAGMYVCGYSIDNLSLLALTLSVGFVVDDAIVMLENIVRHIEDGMKPLEAAFKGSREIGFTIVSITLSLVAVFIPVFFMGGIVGRIFREFAVTISMTILISGIVSLTLTPMLCSRLLRSHDKKEKHNFLYRASEAGFDGILAGYAKCLRFVISWKRSTLFVTFLTLGASIYLFNVVPEGFFSAEDTGLISGFTEAAQDISFESMSTHQQAVAAIVASHPAVQDVNSSIGASSWTPSLNNGRLFITLKPLDERNKSVTEVIQELRRMVSQTPGMSVFFQPIQNINVGGRLAKSQYQYTVQAGDTDLLYPTATNLQERISKLPGFQDVTSDLQLKNRQAIFEIDRDKAAQLGVTADQFRNTLYNSFGTRQISTIYQASNDYQVILEIDPRYQRSPEALSKLYVRATGVSSASSTTGTGAAANAAPTTGGTNSGFPGTAGGGPSLLVPLDAFTTMRQTTGPITVNHQAQLPSVTIAFNLAPGISLGEAVETIRAMEREAGLPASVVTGFQGTAQVFQDSLRGQGFLLLAAVLVIYIVLGILYESFIHPITILSGLPAAGLGAILTLMLFKMDLSVIAIIGIVMLIGIVKKNAIMMIDFALDRQRAGDVTPEKAIYEACLLRFRPIMMTTMAAIMGTLPIALGTGAGAELRQPLGLAVVGGLCVSQTLTLFITPVVYIYLERLRQSAQRRKAQKGGAMIPEAAPGE